jgi:hypothetical protein
MPYKSFSQGKAYLDTPLNAQKKRGNLSATSPNISYELITPNKKLPYEPFSNNCQVFARQSD